jgi:hypothetical protein
MRTAFWEDCSEAWQIKRTLGTLAWRTILRDDQLPHIGVERSDRTLD